MERGLRVSIVAVCLAVAPGWVFAAAPAANGPGETAAENGPSGHLLPRARAAFLAGRYTEADNLYAMAIRRREVTGTGDESLGRSLYELGAVRKIEGRCDQASDLATRGIRILEGAPHPEAQELSDAWMVLGAASYCGHLYSKAESAYLRALDLEQHSRSPRKAAIFESQAGLGAAYQKQGRYTRAEEAYRAARATLQEDPEIDPMTRAFFLSNLGSLLRTERRYSESETVLRQGLAALERGGALNSPVAAYVFNNLAMIRMQRKRYRDAAVLLDNAVAILESGTPLPAADAATLLRNYATCLRKTGHKAKAKEVQSQAGKLAATGPPDLERGMVADVAELARESGAKSAAKPPQ